MVYADQETAPVDSHADRVEADLGPARSFPGFAQECRGEAPDPPSLPFVERVPRRSGPFRSPGLHLDEDQAHRVLNDKVDLPEARAVVPRDQAVAEPLQVFEGQALAGAAQEMSGIGTGIGHAGEAMRGRVEPDPQIRGVTAAKPRRV